MLFTVLRHIEIMLNKKRKKMVYERSGYSIQIYTYCYCV